MNKPLLIPQQNRQRAVIAKTVLRKSSGFNILRKLMLRSSGAPRKWVPKSVKRLIRKEILLDWLQERQNVCVSSGQVEIEMSWGGEREVCPSALIESGKDGAVLFLRDTFAEPIGGAREKLRECLVSRSNGFIAYGDELYRNHDGTLDEHWLKPIRPDPLLAEQGMLLNGLVGIAAAVPGLDELLGQIRAGHTLQAALARFSESLPASALVHCDAPVVICNARDPLPFSPPLPSDPLPTVSVLIPTRNGWDVLYACLSSLRETDWPTERLEIVVIDNGSDDPVILRELENLKNSGQITLIHDDGEFNFSRLNNIGAASARGEVLVLLNNDTTARTPNWLKRLVGYAVQPGIGAVGCKLLYPDDDVQHAGVVFGLRGGAQHAFVGIPKDAPGYNSLANLDRSVSGVTAACLAVTREAFDSVGGLRESLAVSYNDVVLCADLQKAGLRNVCVGEPLFYHHESKTRGRDTDRAKKDRHRAERAQAIALHPTLFEQDPYYSPHLSRKLDHQLLLK